MSFNGSGTFVINSSGQPVVANTVISSTVFNALTADLATGLSTCITKDGQTTPTANIPMGTFKFTNLGVGSAATDSATLGQVQASTTKLVTVTGTDAITGTMIPALTAYASGQMFYFVAGGANTGAVTLNIDGLGARNVTRHGSVALVAGDILSGEVCVVVYDGTRFQLLNPGSYTNLNVSGALTLNGGTANGVLYLNGSKAATSGSDLTYNGTNLGVGGSIGTTPSLNKGVYLQSDSNNAVIGFSLNVNDGANNRRGSMFLDDSAGLWGWDVTASSGLPSYVWRVANSEVMRLNDSGNLGIGTSSPAYKLDVTGALNSVQARFGNVAGRGLEISTELVGGTNDAGATLNAPVAGGTLIFKTVNSERARLDSSGNLGIGTSSPGHRLTVDVGAGAQNIFAAQQTGVSNGYTITSDGTNLTHSWHTAGSVTAQITANGSFAAGAQGALATTATNGFLYVPTCAGVPTGTPTVITGLVPIVVDTTNNRWYFYSGGAWRNAGP